MGKILLDNRMGHYCGDGWDHAHIIERARLTPWLRTVDTLVVCGHSGLLAGPILARRFRKHLTVIRKEKDAPNSHDGHLLRGIVGERYAFVDDFVMYGGTRAHVLKTMDKLVPESTYMGTFQYSSSETKDWIPAHCAHWQTT